MIEKNPQAASQVASYLLIGAHLDSVRVYSSSLVLCFARLNEQQRPDEVWITSTGRIRVSAPNFIAPAVTDALLDQRGLALYVLCQLIGEDVSSVHIFGDGALEFSLGGCGVQLHADEVSTEEVWSITSDSPDPNYQHRWSVTLDELGDVSVHVPDGMSGTGE